MHENNYRNHAVLTEDEQENSLDGTDYAQFVNNFLRYQTELYVYIKTLVGNEEQAHEVFQETSVVLWRKFREFDSRKDFRLWAFGVARREVLKSRRKYSRDRHVFSNDAVMRIAQAEEGFKEYLDERLNLLRICLGKLKTDDRELLDKVRYPSDCVRKQAKLLNMTENVLYKQLARIRRLLMKCVESGLQAGGDHD